MEEVEGLLRSHCECNGDAESDNCRDLEDGHEKARGSPEVLVAADLVILAEAVKYYEQARNDSADGFQAGYEVRHVLEVVALSLY